MQIDKNTVIELLKTLGKHEEANRAQSELPEQVDTERHSGLLSKFGVDSSMLSGLTGGGAGGAGGLLDKAKDMFKG